MEFLIGKGRKKAVAQFTKREGLVMMALLSAILIVVFFVVVVLNHGAD